MIILRKSKKLWEMYPIGPIKGALNSKRTPHFIGTFKLKKDENGKLSISRFIINMNINDNSTLFEKFYPPQEAIRILRKQIVLLANHDGEMEDFLDSININYRFTRICDYCTLENYITIINSDCSYKYHNQYICKDCAEDTIKRELKLRGYDKKVFRNFKKILEKTNDLETVISMLSPKFDPLSHPDLTLYDKVKVDNSRKIPEIAMSRLKIPKEFKDILIDNGNTKLLPVQILSIKEGLLKGENILAVSATGSGKTLIGEIAGIPQALNDKKFIFLTPLVALANQKYRDFKKKYEPLGLKVSIKVGRNRVKAKGELRLPDKSIADSDIIVGTYEALDYMIRSGKTDELNNLGVILIDEIHMIDDEDRGTRLNGLIKRITYLYPNAQLIGLSATVKNPEYLASKFHMNLVQYSNRPVPLLRHLSFVRNESEKRDIMRRLIISENHKVSKKGYKGQTIIFTNSRRKTTQITKYLTDKRIKAAAYHAGLSYYKKERIEKDFDKGKLEAVVTTAALAAGVDFPASQVIFDTLMMGNKWISPNEFSQMLGRAGRPSYHDRGVVYLLPEIGKNFDNNTEEAVALNLLESDNEDVEIVYEEDELKEQILADISSTAIETKKDLDDFYKDIDVPSDPTFITRELIDKGLVSYEKGLLKVTKYGKAVTMSFLSINNAEKIKESIFNINYFKESTYIKNNIEKILNPNSRFFKDIINKSINNDKEKTNKIFKIIDKKELNQLKVKTIAMDLELFDSAYLSPVLQNQIANKLKINVSSRLFAESTLDIISSGDTLNKLDTKFQDALIRLQSDFLRCDCLDKPFCDCLQRGISYLIINERLKGEDPINISKTLYKNYQIHTYPGDIFSWLDNYIKNLDAVKRISQSFDDKKLVKQTEYLIKQIENPHIEEAKSKKHHNKNKSKKKHHKKSKNNKSKDNPNLKKSKDINKTKNDDETHSKKSKNNKIHSKKSKDNGKTKSRNKSHSKDPKDNKNRNNKAHSKNSKNNHKKSKNNDKHSANKKHKSKISNNLKDSSNANKNPKPNNSQNSNNYKSKNIKKDYCNVNKSEQDNNTSKDKNKKNKKNQSKRKVIKITGTLTF